MAFVQSAVNGLVIPVPDRMVAMGWPKVMRTNQNGHLFRRDRISGEVLVQRTVSSPAVPASQAIQELIELPAESRLEAQAKAAATAKKGRAKAVAPPPVQVEVPEQPPEEAQASFGDQPLGTPEQPADGAQFSDLWNN